MDQRAESEEELFASWNTNTVSSILLDVRRFETQVFANIEKQLEFLRRRQGVLYINVDELANNFARLNDNMEMVNSIVDRNSVYRSRRISMGGAAPINSGALARAPSVDFSAAAAAAVSAVQQLNPIDESNAQPSADVSGIQTELQELRADFDELRNQFHNNHALENRFKAMEDSITAQLKGQSRRIDELHDMLEAQKSAQCKIQERLEEMDKDNNARLEAMRHDLENKLQALEYAQMGITKDIDVKVHGLNDTLSVHDLRAKGIESKVSRVSNNIEELREQHNQLQSRYFDQIYASINELYADKASKSDLTIKADLTLALGKADQGDIDRLQSITDELQRRLIALLAETTDKVNAMDTKLDRRSDRIVTYCLKELKKEFKHLRNTGGDGGDDGGTDGTNIGKVRCLVCDHVSTQHRDQDVVNTQHDRLTHTLKTLRPRSPSPPSSPAVDPKRPGTATGFGHTGGNQRPLPTEDALHGGTTTNDDDFRFRAVPGSQKLPVINGHMTATNGLRMSVPSSSSNLAQSAPLIQIISHHLPVDLKLHQAQQLQQQQLGRGAVGATMFSHTANAVVVKTAELYPQQHHEGPSPHNNSSGNNNNATVSSSNAALSRPKSAPPKRT
jgi:hypothetical protein